MLTDIHSNQRQIAVIALFLSGLLNASITISVLSACVSVLLGQLLLSWALRRSEGRSEDKSMEWRDEMEAVNKIFDAVCTVLNGRTFEPPPLINICLLTEFNQKSGSHVVGGAIGEGHATRGCTRRKARHYLYYAVAASGLDVIQHTMLYSRYRTSSSISAAEDYIVPRHFVSVDEARKAIVVAIGGIYGSNSISAIISYLLSKEKCGNEQFAGGHAHGHMKRAAESQSTVPFHPPFVRLLRTIQAIKDHPGYSIVITGHGVGASIGSLLTKKVILMRRAPRDNVSEDGASEEENCGVEVSKVKVKVKCYAFGPCPVFRTEQESDEEWSNALECFVNGDDVVSRLCLYSAVNLKTEMVSDAEKKRILDERPKQLHIPRRKVHWLLAKEESLVYREQCEVKARGDRAKQYLSFVPERECVERIVVTEGCVGAHDIKSYKQAFAGLVE